MFKKLSLMILAAAITIVIFNSCEKGTEPEGPKLKPGRRDYIWTEDTLDVGKNGWISYKDMVGYASNDVWLGTGDASYYAKLWHYNGIKWESIPFPGYESSALWLFEDNTLWAGTNDDYIWKGENGTWTESYKLELENYDKITIEGIYGRTKNNIYAVGWAINWTLVDGDYIYKAVIMHYDGNNWKFVDIPEIKNGFNRIFYQEDIDLFFIHGNKYLYETIYTFDGKNIKGIMSSYSGFGMSKINGTVYINSDRKIYKYQNGNLQLWKDFTGTDFLSDFVGRSETDFINNSTKGLGHYNGIDYTTIYKTNLNLQSKIIFEKEIFVAAEDNNNHYIIIHGKLKE